MSIGQENNVSIEDIRIPYKIYAHPLFAENGYTSAGLVLNGEEEIMIEQDVIRFKSMTRSSKDYLIPFCITRTVNERDNQDDNDF